MEHHHHAGATTSAGGRRAPEAPGALGTAVRVILPQHLRTLARVGSELEIELDGAPTVRAVLDALETRYPVLRGTIRDQITMRRRPFLRFFACEEDLSHDPPDTRLPDAVVTGAEPFLIIGAMAGG